MLQTKPIIAHTARRQESCWLIGHLAVCSARTGRAHPKNWKSAAGRNVSDALQLKAGFVSL
jgi:hypothetical protein